MASRSDVTVAPEGSHWEMNANGAGSSGGATAPPDDALPRMTKNNQVGTIAQRPSVTPINKVNEATAMMCSARIPHCSASGVAHPCRSTPTDERQRERRRHRKPEHEGDVVAQRQPAGLREYLEDGDEPDDRADQHPIEDVQTVGVACLEGMGVDDAHRRIDRVD